MSASTSFEPLNNSRHVEPVQQTSSKFQSYIVNGSAAVVQTVVLAKLTPSVLSIANFAYSWGAWPVGIVGAVATYQFLDTYAETRNLSAAFDKGFKIPATLGKWSVNLLNWSKNQGMALVNHGSSWISNQFKGNSTNAVPAQPSEDPVNLPANAERVNDEPPQAETHLNLDYIQNKVSKVWTLVKRPQIGFFNLAEDFGGNKKAILFGVGVGALHLMYVYSTTKYQQVSAPDSPLNYFIDKMGSYYSYEIAGAGAAIAGLITGSKANIAILPAPTDQTSIDSQTDEQKETDNTTGSDVTREESKHERAEYSSSASTSTETPSLTFAQQSNLSSSDQTVTPPITIRKLTEHTETGTEDCDTTREREHNSSNRDASLRHRQPTGNSGMNPNE